MAKYKGPKCRLCRREGTRLFLKGSRCLGQKCAMVRKNYIPGLQGVRARSPRLSDYALHLREKQKLRRIYNILERQFRGYYTRASRKKGVTGDLLFQILESRLDNVIYRAGFAVSRSQARQLVNHELFLVNKKKVNLPSYEVKPKDRISLHPSARKKSYFASLKLPAKESVGWLKVDRKANELEVLRKPSREDVDHSIDMPLIVEYYSR